MTDAQGVAWIVNVSAAGFTSRLKTPPPVQFVSPYEFRLLFTQSERIAIYGSSDGIVRDFLGELQTITSHVDLSDPRTQAGVGYLAQQGLIEASRVARILAGETP